MSLVELRSRLRRSDRPAAFAVVGDLLLCCVVLWWMVAGAGATTREEETASWILGAKVYGIWLAAGLVLFAGAGLPRTLLGHLATMLLTPGVLFLLVMLLSLR
ncbi:hypothetical protein [Streptomyces sp. S5]|uniref:hypothetical protein n=1 Tax=Streptomyces sp. S5 TaxID=1456735 RepID=UPI001F0A019E|nr:hypothetical protein [Streptomyces sp. S5]